MIQNKYGGAIDGYVKEPHGTETILIRDISEGKYQELGTILATHARARAPRRRVRGGRSPSG